MNRFSQGTLKAEKMTQREKTEQYIPSWQKYKTLPLKFLGGKNEPKSDQASRFNYQCIGNTGTCQMTL